MVRFGSRARGARRQASTIASVVVLALVASALIVFAIRSQGFPVQRADLNDGGVWVTNGKLGEFGRENKPVKQLDLQMSSPSEPGSGDVLQSAQAVFSWDPSSRQVTPVDTGLAQLDVKSTVQLPSSDVSLGGDVLAVADQAGKVWASKVDTAGGLSTLATLDPASKAKPVVSVGAAARMVVSQAGTTYVASAGKRSLTTVSSTPSGFGHPSTAPLDPAPVGSIVQLTTVGERVVWLDDTGALGSNGMKTATVGRGAVLQQPGPDADHVLVATARGLLSVGLTDGATTTVATPTLAGEALAQPVRLGGCDWGLAGAGQVGTVIRRCVGDPQPKRFSLGIDSGDRLVFRVNRDQLLVNDMSNGSVWDVDGSTAQQVATWTSPSQKKQQQQRNRRQAVRSNQKAAPRAEPDDLGVRSGATTVLHVLDNDSAPAHDVLSITKVDNGNKQINVAVAADQQSLLVTVDQGVPATSLSLRYTIDDGEKTNSTAVGIVSLTVHGPNDGGRGTPQLREHFRDTPPPTYPVAAGRSVEVPVLADWRDRTYGDPIALVPGSAQAARGQASITPDGLLRYVAPNGYTGSVAVAYRVTTGGPTNHASTTIRVVSGTRTANPTAEPDVATGEVGSPITIRPLDNDVPGADPIDNNAVLALGGRVPPQPAIAITTDLGENTVTVTGSRAGSFTLPYTEKYGLGGESSNSTIRVVVLPKSAASNAPIATPDSSVLHGSAPATVDVLANDYDQRGRLLAVTAATARKNDGLLDISVISNRWIRVSSRSGDFGGVPETIDYTVSNGYAETHSTLTVTQLPQIAPADDGPDAEPDAVTVRAGSSVEIPVLANDATPSGSPVGLVADQAVRVTGTLPVVDGPGTAYLDGRAIRFVAPPSLKHSAVTHFLYPVQNLSAPTAPEASGQVTVRIVPPPDPKTNPDQAPTPSEIDGRVDAGDTVTLKLPGTGQDPDGDPVTVTGIGNPDGATGIAELGSVTGFSADTITYQAYPGTTGSDSFSYTVSDAYGQTGRGTVHLAVVAPGLPQAPVAVDDHVSLDPSRTLNYDVLANDLFAPHNPPSVQSLRGAPHGVDQKHGVITVKPGSYGRQLAVPYTLTDGLSDSSAQLTVQFRKGFDNPPVAGPVVAKPSETAGSVTVNVLRRVGDVDDPHSDLHLVAVDPLPGVAARPHLAGGKAVLPVGPSPRVWTYTVRDAAGAEAVGSIYVAGRAPGVPMLKPGSKISMKAGSATTIDIRKYVVVPGGGEPYLTTDSAISLHPQSLFAAQPSTPTKQSVRVVAAHLPGSGALAFQVSTAAKLNAARATTATLVLPIVVTDTHHTVTPPTVTCPQAAISIPESGQRTVNAAALCHLTQDSADAHRYSLSTSLQTAVRGLTVQGSGASMKITADLVKAGTRGTIKVSINGASGPSTTSSLPFVITPLPPATMTRIPDQQAEAGKALHLDLGPYLRSDSLPAADFKPTLVSVSPTNGGPRAAKSGTSVTITPPPGEHGTYTYAVQMSDDGRLNGSRPLARGAFRVAVIDVPHWRPGQAPAATNVASTQVTLSWSAPDTGNSPITGYQVVGGPGKKSCGTAPSCTVTGLKAGTTYHFAVVATNAVGASKPSASVAVTPDRIPDPVTNITVTHEADRAISYQWSRPTSSQFSQVTGYLISWDGSGGYQTKTDSGPVVTFTAPNVANGQQITFSVYAVNAKGKSASPGTNTEGVASGRPDSPSAPSVSGSNVAGGGSKAFQVSWNAVAPNGRGNTSYQLLDGGAPVTCGGGAWTQATSCSVQVSNDGSTHTFAVKAANDAAVAPNPAGIEGVPDSHISAPSGSTSAVAAGVPAGFTSGPTLTATGVNGQAKLAFTAGPSNGASGTVTCVSGPASCSYNVGRSGGSGGGMLSGFSNGQAQTITLKYCNGANDNAALGTTGCVEKTSNAVTTYGPIGAASISASANGNVVTVSASANPNGRPVNIAITSTSGNNHTCSGVDGTSNVQCGYTDGNLKYDTTYTYTVTVTDASGSARGATSATASAKTGPPPTSVTVSPGSDKVVRSPYGCSTAPGCPRILVSTHGFTSGVHCVITSGTYGTAGFLEWNQNADEDNHDSGNVQQNGDVTVTCTDQQDHSQSGTGSMG